MNMLIFRSKLAAILCVGLLVSSTATTFTGKKSTQNNLTHIVEPVESTKDLNNDEEWYKMEGTYVVLGLMMLLAYNSYNIALYLESIGYKN